MRILSILRPKRRFLLGFLIVVIFILFNLFYFLNKEKYKILLIGLDGASWKVILPLIEEGKLPNIKNLMDNGCWGNLRVIISPLSSEVIWTTIATGKSPEIHGITGNFIENPDTNERIVPVSNLRKVKAIWNILSDYKKRVGVLGYRVSWPAEKINGVMISDIANQSRYISEHYAEPPFKKLCTEEIFNSFKERKFPPVLMKGEWVLDRDYFVYKFAKYLLRNKKFDFFCLYLRGIDVLSHYYWKYMFPENQDFSAQGISARYKNVINDYYIWYDNIVGDLLKIVDKYTTIIIVSDHGFKTGVVEKRKYIFSKVDDLLKTCSLDKVNLNSKIVRLENTPKLKAGRDLIKNIEIIGDLSTEEFNIVRQKAKNILGDIRVEETKEQLFKTIVDTKTGFLLEADMEYISKNSRYHILINGQKFKILDFFIENSVSGSHDGNDAIIIISGKNILHSQKLQDASVYDIAPSLLYLLRLPLAADMPGKVIISAIDTNYLMKNPVTYIDTYEKNKKQIFQKLITLPAEEERIIKERMRSLGYIN